MKTKFNYILAIDPSGNFMEGKGTTGWILIDKDENIIDTGVIKAVSHERPEEFWNAHKNLIEYYHNKYKEEMVVVIEDYILYSNRSRSHTNSRMETCRLIGLLQWYCWSIEQPYALQRATEVKSRWADDVLEYDGIIRRSGKLWIHNASGVFLNPDHKRDAFRHAIHYANCRNMLRNPWTPKPRGAYGDKRYNYKSEAQFSRTVENPRYK